jgi:glucose/arabinose dehydrogenase
MRWSVIPLSLLIVAAARAGGPEVPPGFSIEQVVGGPFDGDPVGFAFLPDQRIVIVERNTGNVRLAARGASSSQVVFTIPEVNGASFEDGLLGVAVDPGWPARPWLYFHYAHVDSVTNVVMYEASGDLADPSSTALTLSNPYLLLTDVPDSTGIHNAGTLRFGPDGMLYASFGDDGSNCGAQELDSPLGKILRLDPSAMPGAGSGPPPKDEITPAGNPFPATGEWVPLVWSWGLRNPFRFTIDPATGDTFLGDVGTSLFEEIDLVPAASTGPNFGWPRMEGDSTSSHVTCGLGQVFTSPIIALPHESPSSIIGGPRYRPLSPSAGRFPGDYHGDLFFLEFYSGDVYRARQTGAAWSLVPGAGRSDSLWASGFATASDFQEGPDGALWLLAMGINIPGQELPAGLHRIASTRAWVEAPAPGELRARPNPARGDGGVRILAPGSTAGPWTLSIRDVEGRLVRRLSGPSDPGAEVAWDGRAADGSRAAAGVYFAEWRAGGKTSARGKIALLR